MVGNFLEKREREREWEDFIENWAKTKGKPNEKKRGMFERTLKKIENILGDTLEKK